MSQTKSIFIPVFVASLFVLAGCTAEPTTNTNVTVNTNTVTNTNTDVVASSNDNTNEVVINENTNTEQVNEVDTSDWLTYTNEEYGFSFRYPSDWKVEENLQKCWILTSQQTITEQEQFYIDNPKARNGTDAVPGNEMSLCVKDEKVNTDLVQWAEEKTYRYVDEEYRGKATFNNSPAYLIVDLDFGKSNNYFLMNDKTVYSLYYAIVDDSRSEQIDLIAQSVTFN